MKNRGKKQAIQHSTTPTPSTPQSNRVLSLLSSRTAVLSILSLLALVFVGPFLFSTYKQLSCGAVFQIVILPNGDDSPPSTPRSTIVLDTSESQWLKKLHSRAGGALGISVGQLVSGRGIHISSFAELCDAVTLEGSAVVTTNGTHTTALLLYAVPMGEVFMWPPIEQGHSRRVLANPAANAWMTMTTLSVRPRIFRIDEFLSDYECTHLVDTAAKRLERSYINDGLGAEKRYKQVRTSSNAWLGAHYGREMEDSGSSHTIRGVQDKAARWTRTTLTLQESMQVVHYTPQQHYWTHADFHDPYQYRVNPEFKGGRNRMATVLVYLSDVQSGGTTNFPLADNPGAPPVSDITDCSHGLQIVPKKRAAVLFYNLHPQGLMEGRIDNRTWHGGCDVLVGEKWAANLWIYNKPHPQFS